MAIQGEGFMVVFFSRSSSRALKYKSYLPLVSYSIVSC